MTILDLFTIWFSGMLIIGCIGMFIVGYLDLSEVDVRTVYFISATWPMTIPLVLASMLGVLTRKLFGGNT